MPIKSVGAFPFVHALVSVLLGLIMKTNTLERGRSQTITPVIRVLRIINANEIGMMRRNESMTVEVFPSVQC